MTSQFIRIIRYASRIMHLLHVFKRCQRQDIALIDARNRSEKKVYEIAITLEGLQTWSCAATHKFSGEDRAQISRLLFNHPHIDCYAIVDLKRRKALAE